MTQRMPWPPRVPGIYRVTHARTRRCYVGSSINLWMRRYTIRYRLRNAWQWLGCSRLEGEFKNYKDTDFIFEILELCAPSRLEARELFWMNRLKPELNTSCFANRGTRGITIRERAQIPSGGKLGGSYVIQRADLARVPKNRKPGRKPKSKGTRCKPTTSI